MDINQLEWKPHDTWTGVKRAYHEFPNGYAASVLKGGNGSGGFTGAYTAGGTYELAVMYEEGCCYDTPITDDVLKELTKEQVNEVLLDIEALPKQL